MVRTSTRQGVTFLYADLIEPLAPVTEWYQAWFFS